MLQDILGCHAKKCDKVAMLGCGKQLACVECPNAACRNLMTSFMLGNLYPPIAVSATLMPGLMVGSSTIGTIHNPLPSRHPWRAGGAVEDMTTSLAWKTSTPFCPGKNTVMYPLFANVDTLISVFWLIPGTTIASLAPLESARVDRNVVLVAQSFVPPAVTTTLSEGLVSCNPCREFTNILDAPESNIPCVIACSIVLALSCFTVLSAFLRLSCLAQCSVDLDVGLGLASTTERDSSSWGGGSSPTVAR